MNNQIYPYTHGQRGIIMTLERVTVHRNRGARSPAMLSRPSRTDTQADIAADRPFIVFASDISYGKSNLEQKYEALHTPMD